MIINTANFNEALKKIKELKKRGERIIVRAHDPVFNRKILEHGEIDMLLGVENHGRKDSLKQRDSGLNEVMCKLARDNHIVFGVDAEALKKMPKKEKARILGKIMQNIFLCKKIGCQMTLYPREKFSEHEVRGFFTSLKGSTELARINN